MAINIKEELEQITGKSDTAKNDLFYLARKNDKNIETQFEKLAEEIQEEKRNESIRLFEDLLSKWTLTVNMGWRKVEWVCSNKRICNTYDFAIIKAEADKKKFNEALQDVCSDHYPFRIKFHGEIKDEEKFKYTAFDIGTLGQVSFGEFCFIYNNNTVSKLEFLTFVKCNSLDGYSSGTNDLDLDTLFKEISTKDVVKKLVGIKHFNGIKGDIPVDDWPHEICNGKGYVEGIVLDELKLEDVDCVKIDKKLDDDYIKKSLSIRYLDDFSTVEADQVNKYMNAREELKKANITIKKV